MKRFSILLAALNRRLSISHEPSLWMLFFICLTSSIVLTAAAWAIVHSLGGWTQKHDVASPSGKPYFPLGTTMPDFTLPSATGGRDISLAHLRREGKPIVLVFSSFTCTIFHSHLEKLEAVYHKYGGRANFLFVNIMEAGHVIEGYEFLLPEEPGVDPPVEQRCRDVFRAAKRAGLTLPIAVDIGDKVMRDYKAWPLRLLVLNEEGKLDLDLGPGSQGPWYYDSLEKWLDEHTLAHKTRVQRRNAHRTALKLHFSTGAAEARFLGSARDR